MTTTRTPATRRDAIQNPPAMFALIPKDATVASWAMRLVALTAARRSELLEARWEDVDLDAAQWTLGGQKTPISRQTADLLREMPHRAGPVLPSPKHPGEPLHDDFIVLAFRRALPGVIAHDWRLTFHEWGIDAGYSENEVAIELNRLAPKNPHSRSASLMQAWADYLLPSAVTGAE